MRLDEHFQFKLSDSCGEELTFFEEGCISFITILKINL